MAASLMRSTVILLEPFIEKVKAFSPLLPWETFWRGVAGKVGCSPGAPDEMVPAPATGVLCLLKSPEPGDIPTCEKDREGERVCIF